jgi:large subunit ribosomal protein L12
MEYIYAALLLHSAGKEINEENLKKVLEAAGVEINEAKVKVVVESLKDVNIDEITAQPVVTQAPTQVESPKVEEEKKEEEEKEEQVDVAAGLGALFG